MRTFNPEKRLSIIMLLSISVFAALGGILLNNWILTAISLIIGIGVEVSGNGLWAYYKDRIR